MSSLWVNHQANSAVPNGIQPSQTSFADEVCATVARIFLYVGTLALFGILGVHVWNKYRDQRLAEPAARAESRTEWSVADRSRPAFSVSQADQDDRSETYVVLRHPEGGRKDILRWQHGTNKPVAELEIYRPGGEQDGSSPATDSSKADLAGRIPTAGAAELEAAGIVETKFGTVALVRRSDAREGAGACLGFFKRIDDTGLRISGWSCQGDDAPAQRVAIGCMLDRLTLLASGNEPKLADLFARAELKRGNCAATSSSDWVTGVENPKLRGTL
jgi:hypothetical protein